MPGELEGRRILITRTPEQASLFRELLEELGAQVIEVATIEIRPRPAAEIDPVALRLTDWDWLILTSANGVRFFLERCRELGTLPRLQSESGPRVCAVGPATADSLKAFGVAIDLLPRSYRAEGVLEAFRELGQDLAGIPMLLPQASRARDLLTTGLVELGARVLVVPVYDTVTPEDAPLRLREGLLSGDPDLVVLTSSSTATNLVAICHPDIDPKRFRYASIGPITSKTCRELGLSVAVEAPVSTVPGLVQGIREFLLRPDRGS